MQDDVETYELRKKKGLKSSVYAIAFVKNPAIEVGFVALSKDKTITRIKLNTEKRMIYTPVLIPDQKIYRETEDGQGYNIFFSVETIEEAAHDFVSAKLVDEFNNEHQETEKLNGITLVENWIVDNPENDKATQLGFQLPKGTWMAGIKVNDESVWAKCKDGTYEGISIEGLFDNFETNLKKEKMKENEMEAKTIGSKLDEILAKLSNAFKPEVKLASAELQDGGLVYTEGEMEDGVDVYVDEAMEVPAQDGEYVLADGRVLTVSGGKVAGLVEAVEEDLMDKEKKEMMEKIEQLAEYVAKSAEKLSDIEARLSELSEVKEKAEKLEKENADLKQENESVKTELTKEPAVKSATKLSEVSEREGRFNAALRGDRFLIK